MRATPITARLLAATALGLTTSSVYAADYGIVVSDPNPTTLVSNSGLTIGDKTGLLSTGGHLTLTVYDFIIGQGTHGGTASPDGGIVISGYGADINLIFTDPYVSPPLVEGSRFGITTSYYFNVDTGEFEGRAVGTTVVNSGGSIIGDSDDGVRLIGGGSVINSGYIAGRVDPLADGISAFAFTGQDTSGLAGIATVTNLADGIIEGNRFGIILSGGGSVDNSGSISGAAGGVVIQAGAGKIGSITNSGSISGGVRFAGQDSDTLDNSGSITSTLGPAVLSWEPLSVSNSQTGEIHGSTDGITSNGSSLTLDNAGTIRGDGSSAGYYDGNGGVIIAGGPASITNSGTISGATYGISTIYYTDPNTGQQSGLAIGSTINNSGVISGDNDDAIHLIGGGTVNNSGQLLGLNASGVVMFAFGGQDLSQVSDLGTVNNLAGGLIQGDLAVFIGDGGTVNNAGTIIGDFRAVEIARWWDPGRAGTVNNSGTITGNIDFDSLDSASVNNSGTIANPTGDAILSNSVLSVENTSTGVINGFRDGIRSDGASLTLDNAGTIRGNGDQAFSANSAGGVVLQGGPGFITNSGSISGQQFGITTIYVSVDPVFLGKAIGSTVNNSGSIIGDNNDGVRLIGGGTVTNSGYIAGRVGPVADGVSGFAYSDQDLTSFSVIGSVNNLSTGVIEGNRFGIIFSNGGNVTNAGTITGNSGSILLQASEAGNDLPRTGTITNSGTLNGTVQFNNLASATVTNSGTIQSPNGNGVYTTAPGGPLFVNNESTGSITGAASGIRSDGASTNLVNAGSISGLGIDKSETAANGGVVLSGGPASITNTGGISGTQFGIATIYFTNPDNSLSGLAIDTTINNSGSIIGQNNDGIRLHGGTVTNSGYIAGKVGVGADGVSILAFDGQDISGLSSAGIGTVNNLAGGVIEGHREGIIISDGGTVNNAGTINGGTRGAIVLEARDAGRIGTLTNSGMINGTVDFIQLASASLANSGAILAPAGAAVHGWAFDGYMGPLAVTNDSTGTIIGGTSGIFSEGASLSLTNAGTIRGNGTSVTLRTADAGILVTGGPAAITNSGNISGAGFGITTGTYSDFFTNAASSRAIGSTVTNTGSIIGDINDGVRLIGGGTVTNSGLISGRVGGGADGVSMFAFEDQVTTAQIGTVNNLLGGIIDGHRFGIIQSGGGTINNAGTITGGTNGAILIQTGFIGGKTGNLTNSGTINGSTTFFELANASVANTGTMSSNSTAAIISSLTNGPMSVSNGATGSITGATSGILSAGSSLSLTNAGTIRANGSYDGFAASPDGGIDVAGGPANIQNSGTISGQRFGITTSYVLNPNTNLLEGRAVGSTVSNTGNIIGDTDTGVRLIGGGTVTNSGYIAGRVGATADGVWMMAFNTQPLNSFTSIGSVTNLAGGVIEGNRRGVTLANGGSVNNAGTISGNSASIRIVAVAGDTGRTGSVTNSGTLNGAVEFVGLASGGVTNSGTINGTASFDTVGTSSVANVGTISTLTGEGVWASAPGGSLSVNNQATGSITGANNGIRSDGSSLSVTNPGTIRGNAGAGIFSTAGLANITNSGTVSGYYNGIRLLGGGTVTNSGIVIGEHLPSVQFDAGGTLTNSGQIRGVLFYGGGSFTNTGTIVGTTSMDTIFSTDPIVNGTIVNKGTLGGVSFSGNVAGTLNNSGTTGSVTFQFDRGGPATLVNSGTINGGTSTAVELSDSSDTVTLMTGSSISGAVDGHNGSDTLRLSGTVATPTASQTVGRFLNFETFNVLGGYWTAPGSTGTFTSTTLSGGALAVNGTLTSPVTVNANSMLAGTGTITGNITMNSGGIISPGTNAIGTLNVTGNILFNGGSTFSVQTNPNGTSDRLAVTGAVTINKGATLQVLAGIFPNYPATSSYVVMTASGGISGKFDTVVTDYAYFKATVNTQQKGTITVQIAPNGKPLPSAATATTFSAASAVDSLGTSSSLYQSVLFQSLTGARQAFSALSGSAYARLDGLMASNLGRVELGFYSDKSASPTLEWSSANSLSARGLQSGTAMRRGPVSLMMAGGRYVSQLATDSIRADVDTRFLASAAGYRSGRIQALASVTSAWHDVSVGRTIAFPGFADRTSARYAAESHRIELEGSYALTRGAIAIAPYAGLSRLMMKSQAFMESGGISTLSFGHDSRTIDQLRLGVRARATFALGRVSLSPHADVSLNRSWGDVEAARQARFVTGNAGFDSIGSGFDSRMTDVDAGIDAKIGRVTLTGSYRGRLGNRWSDHSAVLKAALSF